jgi:hypothetical protein
MWLKCKVMPGQYSGECAIRGQLFNNKEFSLFAEKRHVNFKGELSLKKSIDGWLQVEGGLKEGNLVVVNLPQPAFENGRNIIVKTEQTKETLEIE